MGARVDKGERTQEFLVWCKDNNYEPIDWTYKTAKSFLRYTCTCGQERRISWKWMHGGGSGCKPCSSVRGAAMRKFTIDQARECFQVKKLNLIATEYKNANTKMAYVCMVCGVPDEMRLGTVNFGHGCRTCANRIKAAARRTSISEASDYFLASGLELLETEFKNNWTRMRYRCKAQGHLDAMALKVVMRPRRGSGCRQCEILGRTGPGHHRWIQDREEARVRKKIIEKCHDSLKHCLMYIDGDKSGKTAELVGYSPQQLRERLEQSPRWPELLKGRWHLDHIFPIIAFIEYGVSEVGVINSLDNLQPLDVATNLSKAGSYDRADFETYLKAKNVEFTRPG